MAVMADYAIANPPYDSGRSARRRVLRAAMDVIPGDIQHAGVTEFVRHSGGRCRFDHGFADIVHRAVIDATGGGEEPGSAMDVPGKGRIAGRPRPTATAWRNAAARR